MLFCVWLCCITRIEGMAVGFTIGCCYLLRKDIIKALGMFLTFVAPASLVLLHYIKFGDAMAYIHYNQGSQGLVQWPPFFEANGQQLDEYYNYSAIGSLLLGLLGAFLSADRCLPIAIFSFVHLMYVSLLFHLDVFRYELPAYLFALFVGFDEFWNLKNIPHILLLCSPVYMYILSNYAGKQIHSNIAWPQFISDMFYSIGIRYQ